MKKKYLDDLHARTHRVIFWTVLAFLGIASLLLMFVLIPLVLFLEPVLVYLMVLVLGLLFGFVFSFVVLDLSHLDPKHHHFLGIYAPAVALLSITLLVYGARAMGAILNIALEVDIVGLSALLLVSYALPYVYYGMKHRKKN